MPEPARHLHVIDAATGDVLEDGCPRCRDLEDKLATEKSDRLKWAKKYHDAIRDNEAEAQNDPLWPEAVKLFEEWKRECRHPNSQWTLDRFECVVPLLRKYGLTTCRRAIAGAAFDAWETKRKNGSTKRHDSWDLIYRDSTKLEEFANRAPRGWEA